MEDNNAKLLDSLLERAVEYGKSSFELAKLKTLDKTSDVVSTLIPKGVVILLLLSFMIFVNFGLAIWLGEILGAISFGFFIIAGFYGIATIAFHFFIHKWLKELIRNYFINQVLK